MSKEKGILLLLWVITAGLLFKFIPKNKIRHAIVAFFYKQFVTWFSGLFIAELGLIKYPVRFFKRANKTSFSFEFFYFPALCAIFNVHFPEHKNKCIKFLYYLFHTGFIVMFEVLVEKYSNLIKYVKWKWYWSFLTVWISYYSSRVFYRWFF
ncbi:CBO0543 family protein [Bacillus sp. FJAT-49711]|uniref:CBO0543 family protein n=1 Tax=Bacillus sp. FJAT-49711 TaxID=2833585 RepID=UPI0024B4AD8D|nr:CBO0543 family protein [Bacillus sp. FJAT-49711]